MLTVAVDTEDWSLVEEIRDGLRTGGELPVLLRGTRAVVRGPDVEAMEETIEILGDPDTMDAIREGQAGDVGPGVDLSALVPTAPVACASPATIPVYDLKAAREALCAAQSALHQLALKLGVDAPMLRARVDRLQALINEIDVHRPLGPDGKHGDLHTPTCGCVERALKLQEGAVLAREVHRLRGQLREAEAPVDRLQAAHDRASAAEVHLVNAVAELRNEIGRALGLAPPHSFHRVATFVEAVAALRARDEAAQAVVRAWDESDHADLGVTLALSDALDALARAHKEA